jgi:hypothetical protein
MVLQSILVGSMAVAAAGIAWELGTRLGFFRRRHRLWASASVHVESLFGR